MFTRLSAGILFAALSLGFGAAASADDALKRGGILTYMIPADGGPTLDGHRETSYAVLHATAPFYSTLIRVNPDNPATTTDFVCDLCTEMPTPTGDGLIWRLKIRQGVKFHDATPLNAHDVATSWRRIVFPPPGIASSRRSNFQMVDAIEDPDDTTVIFRLKFPTLSFLPALASPWGYIYSKAKLEQDQHFYERNIVGSGPFKFESMDVGQSIAGVRNPDYYFPGQPYLDGFKAIFAPKQQTRVDAIRADRAATEFRGESPAARDQLVKELGDKITVQESDWNCGNVLTPNHKRKPFDDVRVRRALFLAIDQWHGAPALSKIAIVRTVGGIVYPGSPLAATRDELVPLPGFQTDLDKSRAEARRLLKEAGAEGLSFEMLNRNVDQPYTIAGTWLVDEFRKIGVTVTQKIVPTGPWFDAMRSGDFAVVLQANCHDIVNPIADTDRYLPHEINVENYAYHDDPKQVDIYEHMLRTTDPAKARILMREYEKQILDVGSHQLPVTWWYRILPMRSYVKGWKISSSHYLNQNLANIWLDR
jgi:peptide/nickel transport system substrate-binding protein